MTCSLRSAAVALVLLASTACANEGGSNEAANAAQGDSLVNSTAEAPAGAPNTSSQATNNRPLTSLHEARPRGPSSPGPGPLPAR